MEEEEQEEAEKSLLEMGKIFLQTPKGKKIIAVAEGVKGAVEDFQMTKALIEKYKPVITTFSVKGRVYDELTNEPLEGVKVKPLFALYPMKLVNRIRKIKIDDPSGEKNILGKIKKVTIEQEYKKYVFNPRGNKDIKTDENGEYELIFGTVSIQALPLLAILKPLTFYELEGFASAKQSLVTFAGEVPQVLDIVPMLNINEAAKRKKEQYEDEVNKKAIQANKFLLDVAELALLTIKAQILKFAGVAQNKLLPLAISLLIIFGLTTLEKSLQEEEVCPNNETLKALIKKRNSIVKQINQMWKVIAANTAIAGALFYLSLQLKNVKLTVNSLPIPLGAPTGVGVPYSLTSRLEKLQQLLDSFSDISKELKKAIITSLIYLVICLILILAFLRRVDELIEGCAAKGLPIPMEGINAELLAIQENSEQQGNLIIANINGFKLSVIKEEKFKVGDLYRRRAIAKNSGGVTILQGEPSFSAEDQILLDELSFYIVQNNLKAY
tara:strand:- start:800 stop:2290 length:1491 start_codon:yes stop_codon:yes gene_type:complete